MAKENLKPVSTRLDPETLKAIDRFVVNRRYWKRNTVINQVLTAVFTNFEQKDIYDMVRYSAYSYEDVECKFELKSEPVI